MQDPGQASEYSGQETSGNQVLQDWCGEVPLPLWQTQNQGLKVYHGKWNYLLIFSQFKIFFIIFNWSLFCLDYTNSDSDQGK